MNHEIMELAEACRKLREQAVRKQEEQQLALYEFRIVKAFVGDLRMKGKNCMTRDEIEYPVEPPELYHLAVLEDAVARCRTEDVRTAEVKQALHFLIYRSETTWPFQQFRDGLDNEDEESRWQLLNAGLDGIHHAFGLNRQHNA